MSSSGRRACCAPAPAARPRCSNSSAA
jgi:hypothetical protein